MSRYISRRSAIISISVLMSLFLLHQLNSLPNTYKSPPLASKSCQELMNGTNGNQSIILWWTPFFSDTIIHAVDDASCQNTTNCLVTIERCFLNKSKVVLFHWLDIQLTDLPPKLPNQTWILFNLESPDTIESIYPSGMTDLLAVIHQFDGVMSYRRDSDIYLPYGRFERLSKVSDVLNGSSRLDKHIHTKRKPVAWMVSNCWTASKREKYVQRLSPFLTVDIYGHCGRYSCPKSETSLCFERMASKYFFYLSFENSLCLDYATEKLFSIFNYDIVPIVFGSANYSAILPSHSFINAHNYKPRQLAKFLKKLMNNKTEYSKYFDWKREFKVLNLNRRSMFAHTCDLCDQLINFNKSSPNFTKEQFTNWWFKEADCHAWDPFETQNNF